MIALHPALVAHLNYHGWSIANCDLVSDAELRNKSFPSIIATPPISTKANNYNGTDSGQRIRLSIDPGSTGIEVTYKSLLVNLRRPNWKKSLARWLAAGVFITEAIHNRMAEQRAEWERKDRKKSDHWDQLIALTGYTRDHFSRYFDICFNGDFDPDRVSYRYGSINLNVSFRAADNRLLTVEQSVQRAARLLTFLEAEGWLTQPKDF